jgi:hypothetical protein
MKQEERKRKAKEVKWNKQDFFFSKLCRGHQFDSSIIFSPLYPLHVDRFFRPGITSSDSKIKGSLISVQYIDPRTILSIFIF